MATATLDTTNPEDLAQFNEALNTAPASRLRDIIRNVCRNPTAASSIISNSLLVTEDQIPEQPQPEEYSNLESRYRFGYGFGEGAPKSSVEIYAAAIAAARAPAAAPPDDGIRPASLSKKRVRARYAHCRRCREEYDISKNSGESCCYHTGMFLAKKAWVDDAKACIGGIEDNLEYWADKDFRDCDSLTAWEEDRLRHAKGWIYTCCGRYYGERGCKGRWHEEKTDGGKRRRLDRKASCASRGCGGSCIVCRGK
jgi:hypothetical protein